MAILLNLVKLRASPVCSSVAVMVNVQQRLHPPLRSTKEKNCTDYNLNTLSIIIQV